MNGPKFTNSGNDNVNNLSDKGDNIMSNTTYEPMKQQCNPYNFPNMFWRDFEDPKTYTINGLGDLVPQSEDSSSVIVEKIDLLENLTVHVKAIERKVHQREIIHWLTRLVQALEDKEAFERILEEEHHWYGVEIDTIVEAVFPQPQAGQVVSVDNKAWQTTLDTMDRLCKRSANFVRSIVKDLECEYQELFDALCYLESKNALPVNLEHLDVKKVLRKKTAEHLKAQPKKTADELFTLLEQNPGSTITELIDLAQNTRSVITTRLNQLIKQGKVYKDKPFFGRRDYRFYAISPETLKNSEVDM